MRLKFIWDEKSECFKIPFQNFFNYLQTMFSGILEIERNANKMININLILQIVILKNKQVNDTSIH